MPLNRELANESRTIKLESRILVGIKPNATTYFRVPSPPNPVSFTDFRRILLTMSKNGLWTAQDGGNPITIWGEIVLGEWLGENYWLTPRAS